MTKLETLRTRLEQERGKMIQLEVILKETTEDVKMMAKNVSNHDKALAIVKEISLKMQNSLSFHISGITSMAMEAVFDNPYKVILDFVERRNKTECDLFFSRDDNKVKPMDASGGGTVDVAAFALRIASWSMENPKKSDTIILDEPFSHLRGEKENENALKMIKEISTKLNLQIIMIGDAKAFKEDLIDIADRVFETQIKNGITKIKVL